MEAHGTFGESPMHVGDEAAASIVTAHATDVLDELAGSLVDRGMLASDAHRRLARWPDAVLDSLVGPADRTLTDLDLEWLHRFEGLTLALDLLIDAVGSNGESIALTSGRQLLTERATLLNLTGSGRIGAGGSCRILRTSDGWIAASMPRRDDFEAAAAWLECESSVDTWSEMTPIIAHRRSEELIGRASLLGLAVSRIPGESGPRSRGRLSPAVGNVGPWKGEGKPAPLVVDLSSLWAGPLCGSHLRRAGARVLKVESIARPDGARRGSPEFYRHLNASKQLVEIDFQTKAGLDHLHRLIEDADIVIEASRPRALAALGIDATAVAEAGAIWCSITAYGRSGAAGMRIGFGDDVAAGAGLVTYIDDEPWFIGDAAADPISGTVAAVAVLGLWNRGLGGLIDTSMHEAVTALTDSSTVSARA